MHDLTICHKPSNKSDISKLFIGITSKQTYLKILIYYSNISICVKRICPNAFPYTLCMDALRLGGRDFPTIIDYGSISIRGMISLTSL